MANEFGDDEDDFVDPPVRKVSGKDAKKGGSGQKGGNNRRVEVKKGIAVVETYGYNDVEPMFRDPYSNSSSVLCVDLVKEDGVMYVGRVFETREDFKIALSIYAINRVFKFKITRFAKLYLIAQCYDKKCDWRMFTHQIGYSNEYEIRKAKLKYVYTVDTRKQFSKHATSKVIAALLRNKYKKSRVGPRARDLPNTMMDQHNVRVTYWKCWKVKELVVASTQGTEESSYKLLPVYLHVLKLTNS